MKGVGRETTRAGEGWHFSTHPRPCPLCPFAALERATTYGLVAAVAVALALITVIVASNAQTASAATARANTPIKVVSYQSLAPEQVEKAPYRSPFDSPTI